MIPVIYSDDTVTLYQYALCDAINCTVTKSESGEYYMSLSYPVCGVHADKLVLGALVGGITSRVDTTPQFFRVAQITQDIKGIVSVTANHYTYALSGYPVRAFSASARTPAEAVAALHSNVVRDIAAGSLYVTADASTTQKEFGLAHPASFREAIFGSKGLLDVYGGVIVADNRSLTWKAKDDVGAYKGVIRYGVNLQKYSRRCDVGDMYSHAYVYWENRGTTVDVPLAQLGNSADFVAATILDLSSEFESKPTTAQLTAKAKELAAQRELTTPEISMDISFVPLRLTDEYKSMVWLEDVDLYDTVDVQVPMFGTTRARITKTQFDVISEAYTRVYIGTLPRNIGTTIARLI